MSNSLWTNQAPLSMGFSRQGNWSGLPFPSPGDLPDPGIKLRSPAPQAFFCIAGRFFTNWATREAHRGVYIFLHWCFWFVQKIAENETDGLYDLVLNFLRKLHIIFYSDYTNWHYKQNWNKILFFPNLHQHLLPYFW